MQVITRTRRKQPGAHGHGSPMEGDLDPLLSSQIFDKLPYRMPTTAEERLAWGLLKRIVLDACGGPKRARLKFIAETEAWIGGEAVYTFADWCGALGVVDAFMADRLRLFLAKQRNRALMGKKTVVNISWEVGQLGDRRPDLHAFSNRKGENERKGSRRVSRGAIKPVKAAVPQLQHPSAAMQDGEQATQGQGERMRGVLRYEGLLSHGGCQASAGQAIHLFAPSPVDGSYGDAHPLN